MLHLFEKLGTVKVTGVERMGGLTAQDLSNANHGVANLVSEGSAQVQVTLDAGQVPGPGTYKARILINRNNALSWVPVTFDVQAAPNTGVVTGQLADVWSGTPVYGKVLVGAGPSVQTSAAGQYTVTLPFGNYSLTATATGYLSTTKAISVNGAQTADLVLTPDLPHAQISGVTPFSANLAFGEQSVQTVDITNAGTKPLTLTASVPNVEWAIDADLEAAGTLFDLSGAPALSLGDDFVYPAPLELGFSLPIYGQAVSEVYLSSNGWVSIVPPDGANSWSDCLPDGLLPEGSLAPFWSDLDPSEPGAAVRAVQVKPDTYVISFENVPPWRMEPDPAGPTYTFQLVLHASGQVDFLYGQMDDLPGRWTAGVFFDAERSQNLACQDDPAELTDGVWTLHNQPSPKVWLAPGTATLTVPPGSTRTFQAVLSGLGYVPWSPGTQHGVLRLVTNDPALPAVDLPAEAVLGPAPYTVSFPFAPR